MDKKAGRRLTFFKVIFFAYLLCVIKVFIFKYPMEELKAIMDTWQKGVILEGLDAANFTLFKTIRMYIRYTDRLNSFENLVGNLVVFLPFGYVLPIISKQAKHFIILLIYAFFFSLAIEVFQLVSAFGAFDVDDILLNCIGAIVGFFILKLNERLFKF